MSPRFPPLVLCCLCLSALTKAQVLDTPQLDTLFNRLARHNKAMGSVQLSRNGKVLYKRSFQSAEVQLSPVNADDPAPGYRIGSITKMFTAVMIFQLEEEKKISLNDRLSKWFPQVKNAEKITVDQLLTHRSGLHNITEDTSFQGWQDTVQGSAQILARIAGLPSDFAPGEKNEYSNTNFILLGYIIEAISGKSYTENLGRRIAAPLRLSSTAFGGPASRVAKGEVPGYSISDGKWTRDQPSSTAVAGGAGGIVSTPGDLTTFINALMRYKLISKASLQKMMEMQDGYGRGIMQFPFYSDKAYGHNGHIDNFSSSLAFFPRDSLVVSIICNGVNYSFNNILIGVLSIYYGKPFPMPDFSKAISVDSTKLKLLEGTYSYAPIGMDIVIRATGSGITAQATGQDAFPLEAVSDKEFSNDEVGASLLFDQKGDEPASAMMLSQGGSRIPFERKK